MFLALLSTLKSKQLLTVLCHGRVEIEEYLTVKLLFSYFYVFLLLFLKFPPAYVLCQWQCMRDDTFAVPRGSSISAS